MRKKDKQWTSIVLLSLMARNPTKLVGIPCHFIGFSIQLTNLHDQRQTHFYYLKSSKPIAPLNISSISKPIALDVSITGINSKEVILPSDRGNIPANEKRTPCSEDVWPMKESS